MTRRGSIRRQPSKTHKASDRSLVLQTVKLDFDKLPGLYGRGEHIETLTDVYEKVCGGNEDDDNAVDPSRETPSTVNTSSSSSSQAQVLLVHGYAGSGKTALVRELRKIAPIYVEGTHEQYSQEPFAALLRVYKELRNHPRIRALTKRQNSSDNLTVASSDHHSVVTSLTKQFDDIDYDVDDQISVFSGYGGGSVGGRSMASCSLFYGDGLSVYSGHTRHTRHTRHHHHHHHQQHQQHQRTNYDADDSHMILNHGYHNNYSFVRLKTSFLGFVKSISSPSNPIVIVLDNLQWADAGSLEIFKCLAKERECRGLLLVGIYRDNEMTPSLKATLVSVSKNCGGGSSGSRHSKQRQSRKQPSFLTHIVVKDLNLDTVNHFVADVTSHSHSGLSKTMELAQVVHRKTRGNAFFVIQFLRLLQDEGLLYMNVATYKWEWKIQEIISRTSLADNVVGLVARKICRLSPMTQEALKIAACLGRTVFDLDTLSFVAPAIPRDQLYSSLETGVNAMLLERSALEAGRGAPPEKGQDQHSYPDGYRFGHDRIQQAAYELIGGDQERQMLHLQIGQRLRFLIGHYQQQMHNYHGNYFDPNNIASPVAMLTRKISWLTLACVDQLNEVSFHWMPDPNQVLDLVALNVAASDQVIQRSAFWPARKYLWKTLRLLHKLTNPRRGSLQSGIGSLGDDDSDRAGIASRWQQYYGWNLEICIKLAGIECSLGRFVECQKMVVEIMTFARTPTDRLPAYFAQVEALSSQGRIREAIDVCGVVLQEWGEPLLFRRRVTRAKLGVEVAKTKWMLKGKTDDTILSLPVMTDEGKIAVMKIYCKLSHLAWWASMRELACVVALRVMRLTLTYGLNDASSHGFAVYAAVIGMMGHYGEATRFGELALTLMDTRPEHKLYTARTLIPFHSFVNHLTKPLHESLDPMLFAYKIGMETGDCPFAFLAATLYASIYFVCGLPLTALQLDMKAFAEQMGAYNQVLSGNVLQVFWQTVLNLSGMSDHQIELTGEAMDQDQLTKEAEETEQYGTLRAIWYCRMFLAFHFGHFELAAEMADRIYGQDMESTTCTAYSRIAYVALSFLADAGTSKKSLGKKQCLQRVRKCLKELEDKKVNCQHLILLIQAERAAYRDTNTPVEEVRKLFNDAITSASRRGALHDAAIANERLGTFMMRHKEREWGEHYLTSAHRLYCEWGAMAKVQLMERLYDFLADSRSMRRSSSSVGIKARQRFSFRIAAKHHSVEQTVGN